MSSYDVYRDSVSSPTALARYSAFEPIAFGEVGPPTSPSSGPVQTGAPEVPQPRMGAKVLTEEEKARRASRRLSSVTALSGPTLMDQANALREERALAEEERLRAKSIRDDFKDEEQVIAAPVLSKDDWLPGESRKEAHAERHAKRDGLVGKVNVARNCCARWAKRLLIGFAVFCVALAITLALCVPRLPTINISQSNIFTSTDPNPFVASNPAAFHYNAFFSLNIDTYSSYIPIHFSELSVVVRDYETGLTIGQGNKTFSVDGRKSTDVKIPTYMQASFLDMSDTTYVNMRTACAHEWAGAAARPTVNVTLVVTSKVQGRFGTQVSERLPALGLACPVQWNATAG